MQNVSKEFRNKTQMDSDILKYQSLQWQMSAAALVSLWSKQQKKKEVWCALHL